jgi:hypothetical protein
VYIQKKPGLISTYSIRAVAPRFLNITLSSKNTLLIFCRFTSYSFFNKFRNFVDEVTDACAVSWYLSHLVVFNEIIRFILKLFSLPCLHYSQVSSLWIFPLKFSMHFSRLLYMLYQTWHMVQLPTSLDQWAVHNGNIETDTRDVRVICI